MSNKRQVHDHPTGEIQRIPNPKKKGSTNRRIIAKSEKVSMTLKPGCDYFLHATKGWRRYSK